MLSIRIAAAGAVLVMTVGCAAAQSTTGATPGKPISLLQVVQKPARVKTKPHAKFVKRSIAKKRGVVAVRAGKSTHRRPLAQAAAAPTNIWPALEPDAVPVVQAVPVVATDPVSQPQPAPSEPDLKELVVDGRTVQVDSPTDVNAMDLAADKPSAAATKNDSADGTPAAQPAAHATAVQSKSPVGSASWIAQVMAALGGAVAAGSIAWFLIGSAPHRMYG